MSNNRRNFLRVTAAVGFTAAARPEATAQTISNPYGSDPNAWPYVMTVRYLKEPVKPNTSNVGYAQPIRRWNTDSLNASALIVAGTGGTLGWPGAVSITVENTLGNTDIRTPEGLKSIYTYQLDGNGQWINGVGPPPPENLNQLQGTTFTEVLIGQTGSGLVDRLTYRVGVKVAGTSDHSIPGSVDDVSTSATYVCKLYFPEDTAVASAGTKMGTQPISWAVPNLQAPISTEPVPEPPEAGKIANEQHCISQPGRPILNPPISLQPVPVQPVVGQ